MSQERPDIPAWLAQLDQAMAGLRDHASMLAGYRDALIDQEFSRAEAIQLCRDLQTALLMSGPAQPDE